MATGTKRMEFDVVAKDNASSKLELIGKAVDNVADKLDALGRKDAKPKITLQDSGALTDLQNFDNKIKAIQDKRVKVGVDVDGTAEVGDLRRELSYMTNKTIKIQVQTADSNQKLKTITDRLKQIADTKAKVDITVTGENKLDEVFAKLVAIRDLSPVKVRIEIESNARSELNEIERSLGRINGQTANARVSLSQDWDDSLERRIGSLITAFLAIPAAGAGATAALGSFAASLASLVGGLGEVTNVALLIPGAMAAIAATMGTVKIATAGLGDAFDALFAKDPTKLAEAMKELAPAAREVVTSVGGLVDEFDRLKLDVQQRAFAGLSKEIDALGATYAPVFRAGLGGIADGLNDAATGVTSFLKGAEAVENVEVIFRNTGVAVDNLAPAAANVTAAFLDIAAVGSDFLPGFAAAITDLTGRFRMFIDQAAESGKLAEWIQTGIDRVVQLGNVAQNTGGILSGLYTAANAAGADFITMLEKGTGALNTFVNSAEGQNALKAFFEESRQTVDALIPGLVAAKDALVGFVQGFNDTNGLARFAAGISDVARTIGPLIADLGRLAGDTLGNLGDSLTTVGFLFQPIVAGIQGLLSVLGPVASAVLAMVAAFVTAKWIGGFLLTASASMWTFSQATFASSTAAATATGFYTRLAVAIGAGGLSTALLAVGKTLPLIGIAIVGATLLWNSFKVESEEAAQAVIDGSKSMTQAIREVAEQQQASSEFWTGKSDAPDSVRALAKAYDEVRGKMEAYIATLSPMDQLEKRVSVSTKNLADEIAEHGAASEEAARAADVLAIDTKNLEEAQRQARIETKLHADGIKDLADEMATAMGQMLDYEEAVRQTADANKAAEEALKTGGAATEEYQTAVGDLARNMLAQAEAAQRVAEENFGAAEGNKAFGQELLKMNNGTQSGRDALLKLAGAMDNAELSAFNAAAETTGLNTEIVKLPDGREINLVVKGDVGNLPTIQDTLRSLSENDYVGEIKVIGDMAPFEDGFRQTITYANGQQAVLQLDANEKPVYTIIDGVKYWIDSQTGVLTIDGNAKPGEDNLSGFKIKIDSTTGKVTFEATEQPADSKLQAFVGKINTMIGVLTIDGDTTLADGKTSAAVKFADGSRGVLTIDGNETPVNGKIKAQIQYADGSVGTILLDANDERVKVAQANAKAPLSTTWTAVPDTRAVDEARRLIRMPINVPVTYTTAGGGSTTQRINKRGNILSPSGAYMFADGGVYSSGTRPMPQTIVPFAAGGVYGINDPRHPSFARAAERRAREAKTGKKDNAGRAGYVQAEDGSWVPKSFYRQTAGKGQAIRTEDGGYVGPEFYGVKSKWQAMMQVAVGFANGGTFPGDARPHPAGVPFVAEPNVLRMIGDRTDVPEAYIPLKKTDSRAQGLLDYAAVALGRTILPMANGGVAGNKAGMAQPAVSGAGEASSPIDDEFVALLDDATQKSAELQSAQELMRTALDESTTSTDALSTSTTETTASVAAATLSAGGYTAALGQATIASGTQATATTVQTAAVQTNTGATDGQTASLAALASQAAGGTTSGVQALTGATDVLTGAEQTGTGTTDGYSGSLGALAGQAGTTAAGLDGTTGAVDRLTGAEQTSAGAADAHGASLAGVAGQAGTTAGALDGTAGSAQALGGAHDGAAGQAQTQAGSLDALAGSAGTAAGELDRVASAVSNLPDGEFTVTANGRLGAISGQPAGAATGGILNYGAYAYGGITPGYTPGRDVHSFSSPTGGRLELSGGEAVMRPEWTKEVGSDYVHAANRAAANGTLRDFLAHTAPRRNGEGRSGDGSMLATGGIWNRTRTRKSIGVQRFALGGEIARMDEPPYPQMPRELWLTLAEQMADNLTPMMQEMVKAKEAELAGGDALAWARTQVGKPYQWGGVGPGGYDCSGFMSAILNVMNGKPPHSRVGSTASFPWGGFQPGIGGRFSIGAFKGNPGHMAGTLGGTNVESSGSVGVRVGGGARGASDGMFNIRAHVKDGGILRSIGSHDEGSLSEGMRGFLFKNTIKPERMLPPRTTQNFETFTKAVDSGKVQVAASGTAQGNYTGPNVGAFLADVRKYSMDQLSEIRTVATELMARPAITVNDTSGDSTETARMTIIASRVWR